MASSEPLNLCSNHIDSLKSYLPNHNKSEEAKRNDGKTSLPHVTLTYAASLDSTIAAIAVAPKTTTTTLISGYETKAMTHYLRAVHSAILVGSNTAITDDPRLTSRWIGAVDKATNPLEYQPRPVILDPSGRWLAGLTGNEKLLRLAHDGDGHAPWVITDTNVTIELKTLTCLQSTGGKWLKVSLGYEGRSKGVDWNVVLSELMCLGIQSVMVEGGATVINDLLRKKNRRYLSSIIVTIAPIFLGAGGVIVSPHREDISDNTVYNLREIKWIQMGKDVVMAALS
ncbi:2,5-diamino-6-ribosylamino-4-pyrimidinone 5'-phosphate reductase [Erysiphe neolycopersici]|uniref:2,5-diamino-6-ribosylamino-4(3H)-pyrimidinone 5'-phosphate reductase n=1 Tax=Erysiphe neolycopersici TaxID=212602 RepID=A0A420HKE8_9PEZI|nr:2,5-diamino-6-ribosylamino-4-pyrimidinone 5'-phosphate reductase [Erysiphe neolycopersici]